MPQPLENEASPMEPLQALPAAASGLKLTKSRHSTPVLESLPLSQSETNLAFRRSNPSAASLYASTLSPPGSRSISPAGRGSPSRVLSHTVFDARPNRPLPETGGDGSEPLNLILRAFVPHVSIYTSEDTDALMSEKGFRNSLWELLRPFGEDVPGKVTIRDSNGLSKVAEGFSIRFSRFGDNIEHPDPTVSGFRNPTSSQAQNGTQASTSRDKQFLTDVEAVVDSHLSYAEESFAAMPHRGLFADQETDSGETSPYYALYLRRLLSGLPISPHETFSHPIACVIAISSRNPDPLEELRRLYTETNQGAKKLPPWVDSEFLRYYVLVHDEEKDDITKSMGLFEQMKRHLGMHCHLLRLRSSQSAETDDDSIPLPRSDWMSAHEELEDIRRSEDDEDFEDPTRYIFESDATAIRTFVREMVTMSIVPHMERNISLWNDQVASRRRGLTGRFMNLSRKWAFGGSSRNSTGGTSNARDNYNAAGFYGSEAPEAIMRKLADYAFMLRDWKLAHSTYDLLRSDFSDSKAWKHHAAANEMAALSLLILPQQMSSKNRAETIDQMLEAAFYSYNTRCSAPYGALRSLLLSLELLRLRGGTNIDDAGRWGVRLLESKIAGNVGDALIKERIATCYSSKEGVGSWRWGSRRRKSATWSILSADAWLQQSKHIQARRCLDESQRMYSTLPHKEGIYKFEAAGDFMASLQHSLAESPDVSDNDGEGDDDDNIDEESEALNDLKPRRPSTVAADMYRDTTKEEGSSTDDGT
ncbi:ER-golgi trafficking TRAPP I complex 85 kDa subunit-domain-containing protein [Fusarium tricinctum]|uniref:ER-golgi trafficking TRAPP I complex 85 kDa subunit-domain-containing protein n=2 Tax=Fusarium tricinctum species complex TaxID=679429 RepID=A0A8K0RWB9_9HYPO|nr:ER-golgi trafficking TRAPP I complex 85 kDa subunit-domain-containing protein [Fusarium tricinctum]